MSENYGGTKIPNLTYPVLGQTSQEYIDISFLEEYIIYTGIDPLWPSGDFQAKGAASLGARNWVGGPPQGAFKLSCPDTNSIR